MSGQMCAHDTSSASPNASPMGAEQLGRAPALLPLTGDSAGGGACNALARVNTAGDRTIGRKKSHMNTESLAERRLDSDGAPGPSLSCSRGGAVCGGGVCGGGVCGGAICGGGMCGGCGDRFDSGQRGSTQRRADERARMTVRMRAAGRYAHAVGPQQISRPSVADAAAMESMLRTCIAHQRLQRDECSSIQLRRRGELFGRSLDQGNRRTRASASQTRDTNTGQKHGTQTHGATTGHKHAAHTHWRKTSPRQCRGMPHAWGGEASTCRSPQ